MASPDRRIIRIRNAGVAVALGGTILTASTSLSITHHETEAARLDGQAEEISAANPAGSLQLKNQADKERGEAERINGVFLPLGIAITILGTGTAGYTQLRLTETTSASHKLST